MTSFLGCVEPPVDAMVQGNCSLSAAVSARLNLRLMRDTDQPLVIGLSGGGDSVALALMVEEWARTAARPLVFVTVDHALQPQSRDWTRHCAELAERLGHRFLARVWTGRKPKTGLPAAARGVRHRLLAEAARELGASVILLGHTGDDLLESEAMRREGATTPDAHEWAPSPVWPEGRGLFVLRPMLGIRRAALRDWLVERGETWIEDPANGNLAYARARARPSIDPGAKVVRFDPPALKLAAQATHRAGVITLSRTALREVSVPDAHRFVALAGVSAGGGARLPASARINRAVQALRGEAIVKATLAGARLEADDRDIHVFREAGEAARGGLMPITPEPGLSFIWDGRFEIAASFAGAEVRRLAGLVGRLPSAQRAELRSLPPAARSGLPATLDVLGYAGCLTLTGQAESLVAARFAAAAGLIDREPKAGPALPTSDAEPPGR